MAQNKRPMNRQELQRTFALKHDQILAAHKARGGEIFAGFGFENEDPIRYASGADEDVSFHDYMSFLKNYATGCANNDFCDDTRRCPYDSNTTYKRDYDEIVLVAKSIFGETAERQTDDWAGNAPEARKWIVFPMGQDPFNYLRSLIEGRKKAP
jgi:hypothetical protein